MEIFGTFFLVFSIFAVAVHRGDESSCLTKGGVIGGTLFFSIVAFGPVTGAALNPARTFGPSLIGNQFEMNGWWIYYLGPVVGGIIAALVYDFTFNAPENNYIKANREDDTDGIMAEMTRN